MPHLCAFLGRYSVRYRTQNHDQKVDPRGSIFISCEDDFSPITCSLSVGCVLVLIAAINVFVIVPVVILIAILVMLVMLVMPIAG